MHRFHRRRARAWQLATATATALIAGTTAALGLATLTTLRWEPADAALIALAAVWIPQTLLYATLVHHRRTREPHQ